jgi:putative spermidine/putrescine transport system permease protein
MTGSAASFRISTARRSGKRNASERSGTVWMLLVPAILFLVVLFVVPIVYVLILSITDPTLSFSNYNRIFTMPLYSGVMLNTFKTSFIVTFFCLVLGYPLAYSMATRDDIISTVFLIIVGLSFWTGFIVRTYAWLIILGNKGPVIAALSYLGISKPPQILFTSFSSTLGMIHILLPYMVLALYGVMKKIDPAHLRAAASLGARPFAQFRDVFLPLSLPGVVNGVVLVFTICIGFYVTPILLGSPKDMMISQLINQQMEELVAWGFASALAVVLLVSVGSLLAIYNRFAGLDRLWG